MLKDFIKVLLLIFLATLASVAYAQDSENTSESVPKEFINIQQDVFDSLNLIFEKNSQELDVIQKKLSDNLDVIFEEKSQELSNIQSEVFQNLDGIFETNSKELADVQTDLNKLSKQISEIRLELSENKDFVVTEAINAAEGIVASGIKKSAGNVLFRINAIEEEMRNLTGIIEELQFYTRNIAIDATNRIGDLEFRLTELEGGDLLLLGKPREIGGNLNRLNNAELAVTEKSSYETAQKLLKDNDFQSALLEFNKLITAFPNSPLIASAYYNMGDAYSGLSDWELAVKSYFESLRLDPDGKYSVNALKVSYETILKLLNKNEYEIALLQFDKLLNLSSDEPLIAAVHYSKGNAHSGLNDYEAALKSYLKSFELEPDGKYATKALQSGYQTALESLNESDFKLAIIQFDKLINAIPDGPLLAAAHYSKGDTFIEMEKWKFAGKSYLESFKLEPNGKFAAKALMNVGISLGKMQKINEACNILSKVELRFPNNQIVEEAQNEMQILGCS